MNTPAVADTSVVGVQGLTHPAGDYKLKWYGFKIGGYFFRLVDGDRYVAVLNRIPTGLLVDTIPFKGSKFDPRPDIERLATAWATQKGLLRRAG